MIATRRAADERAGRDPDRSFDETELFLHDVPPEALEGAPPPRDQSGTPIEDPWPPSSPDESVHQRGPPLAQVPIFQLRRERLLPTHNRVPASHANATGGAVRSRGAVT